MEIVDALVLSCPCDTHRYFIGHKTFKFADTNVDPKFTCNKCKKPLTVLGYRKIIVIEGGPYKQFTCKSCGASALRDYYTVQGCRDCGASPRMITVKMSMDVMESVCDHQSIYRPWKRGV